MSIILSLQAQQFVLGARHQAQQEVLAREAAMQREAQQFVESNVVRPLQDTINLGNQQLADREVEITERDSRIAFLESQLAEARQQRDAAVASPVPASPTPGVSNLMELLADPPQSNVNPRDSPDVVEEFDLFANDPVTPVRPQNWQLLSSPQNTAVSQQAVLDPGIFEGTTLATPRVSVGHSINEVVQNAVTTLPQSFHPPGFAPVPV